MSSTEATLKQHDPELHALIKGEQQRQREGIELIASENFTSRAVMEALGSCLTNKYSEGQPFQRYYGGNEFIDQIEELCKRRALKAFGLHDAPDVWDVNVQPYSGSPANLAVYTALLSPHDRVMGLDLPSGGHLTHGYYTAKKKISATSIFFESYPYKVDPQTGLIDYDGLEATAKVFRPKMIICGHSAYPRVIDFARFRSVADSVGAYLLCDMAHFSGLVASGDHPSPFPHCDVVTSTTHKTLRGPRSGVIFFNKQRIEGLKGKIDGAVFPSLQGGPHNHQIAALAAQLKEVDTPSFRDYCKRVVANSRTLAARLVALGFELATGGTDNHLIVWDLRKQGVSGAKLEKVAEEAGITLNKNCVPGDVSALSPSGVRIGTPAMTTRGCGEAQMVVIADFLKRVVDICLKIQASHGKKLVDFNKGVPGDTDVLSLRAEVRAFARDLVLPGVLVE